MTVSSYYPPTDTLAFTLRAVGKLEDILALASYETFSEDLVGTILEEAAVFAEGVLSPLNRSGDKEGCRIDSSGHVILPKGFKEAYEQFVKGGWNAAPFPIHYGGMGLPSIIHFALQEIWHAANLSFALIPLLTQSAVHVLSAYGTEWQKRFLLPKLVSGEWSGTMCITEPQAGSDVGAISTRAFAGTDGTYRIKGGKIFISAGDHDASANIVHLVLARLPDAPDGTKGLSLFAVPKLLLDADGNSTGEQNDLRVVALEHKLGMHASPTAVMSFGDHGGAIGTLIGSPHEGIKAMFVMMNAARLGVGFEGLGIAEAATQTARRFAEERRQGRIESMRDVRQPVAIIRHPDVQRMLAFMESHTQGLRALAAYTGALSDTIAAHPDEAERIRAGKLLDLLTPVVKSHATSTAFAIASEALQIHGGMGYIEETGVAQYMRDVRVTMIYEGTNGIQALDLVSRKLGMDKGDALNGLLGEIESFTQNILAIHDSHFETMAKCLNISILHAREAGEYLLGAAYPDTAAQGGSFLTLLGLLMEGYLLVKGAAYAVSLQEKGDSRFRPVFLDKQIALAEFFIRDTLLGTFPLKEQVKLGNSALKSLFT